MSQPNMIFLLADDLGWMDLSCQGSTFYETPNLDRLAREGMRFTNAYAACPVCSPTRASIMTGKYPARVGITDWINWRNDIHPCRGKVVDVPYLKDLPLEEKTLAASLREGGYATWHVGKWHLGGEGHLPQNVGFDVNIGGSEWGCPCGRGGYWSPWGLPDFEGTDVPEGTYLDDALTDRAIELIQNRDTTKPFFLNLWFYLVHTPIMAKEADIAYFTEKAKRLGLSERNPYTEGELFPAKNLGFKRITRRTLQSHPVYAAMLKALDDNIGRVLNVLDECHLTETTLVSFTSDNGGLSTDNNAPTCNAPLLEGKGWMYEGGTREPLMVRWPEKISPGSMCDDVVTSTDFYPTFLAAAGMPLMPEQHVDGENLLPLLEEKGSLEREAIYWHYPHYGQQGGTPGSSIRCGEWKLIEFFESMHVELYHLGRDEGEHFNCAEKEPAIRDRLLNMLHTWQRGIEAKIPMPSSE